MVDHMTAAIPSYERGPLARPPVWRQVAWPVVESRTWGRSLHHLLSLPIGIGAFVVAVTLLAVGVGTLVTLIGIPVLLLLLLLVEPLSAMERGRARILCRTSIASPFAPVPVGVGLGTRAKLLLTDAARWRGVLYALIALPVGIATSTATIVLWSVGLGSVSYPLWGWITKPREETWTLWFKGDLSPFEYAVVCATLVAGGALVLLATPHVLRGMAAVHTGMVRVLLGRDERAAFERRVTALAESRDASVGAAEAERRRIERNLHDGAQQRLVALAMELGLARERLSQAGDDDNAQRVGRAHDEAKRALTELRELVRGLHPAILTERGLDAALSAVAARTPLSVDLRVDLPDRPSAHLEAVAYFVVTEALTNVSKHAGAQRVVVEVRRRSGSLLVEVADDGRGGAAVTPDGGLAGLLERVQSAEGRLELDSPPGGPTRLTVDLPWVPGDEHG
jgi:signal transduction histidine kinase